MQSWQDESAEMEKVENPPVCICQVGLLSNISWMTRPFAGALPVSTFDSMLHMETG